MYVCMYVCMDVFFFNDTATTEIYTLSLHDALPICWAAISPGPLTNPARATRSVAGHMKPVSTRCVTDALHWRYATKKFDAWKKIPAEAWSSLEQALVLSPS